MKAFLRGLISVVVYILLVVLSMIGFVVISNISQNIIGGIFNFVKDLFFSIVSRRVFYRGVVLFITTSFVIYVVCGAIEFIKKCLKRR